MRRGQPEVQREECRLEHQAGAHQAHRGPRGRLRVNPLGQQCDVDRPVGVVKQCDPEQIGERSEQADQQIAHRPDQRIRTAHNRRERHRRETQDLQRHIEIEDVGREEERIERRQQEQPEWPEGLPPGGCAPETGGGVKADAETDDGGHEQHRDAQPVRVEIDAQGRTPAAHRKALRAVGDQLGNLEDHGSEECSDTEQSDRARPPSYDEREQCADQGHQDGRGQSALDQYSRIHRLSARSRRASGRSRLLPRHAA